MILGSSGRSGPIEKDLIVYSQCTTDSMYDSGRYSPKEQNTVCAMMLIG